MSEKLAVGVDLGATNVRVAVGNERWGILVKLSEATERREGPEGISRQIIRMIRSIRHKDFSPEKILGVGIGSIGPLDPRRGAIAGPANLPWEYVPLVEPIQESLGFQFGFSTIAPPRWWGRGILGRAEALRTSFT